MENIVSLLSGVDTTKIFFTDLNGRIRGLTSRVYEFHPWEKKIADLRTYVGDDVPILDYLKRLEKIGEYPSEYESIRYYFG
ncbi:MAG TPA: hypothetical protein DCR97_13925 [Deltaproteobacteria bacterium]|nr:hypothetical protein [Deltaproteobacteria bacterium]